MSTATWLCSMFVYLNLDKDLVAYVGRRLQVLSRSAQSDRVEILDMSCLRFMAKTLDLDLRPQFQDIPSWIKVWVGWFVVVLWVCWFFGVLVVFRFVCDYLSKGEC